MADTEQLQTSGPEKLSGFEWWRRSVAYKTGLGMDDSERAQFEHDYIAKYASSDCQRCEKNRDWMLQNSPSVTFMMDHVKKLNGNLGKRNIVCGTCDNLKAGGFHPSMGILLCSNWLKDKWQLEEVLTHELVHAYDHLKFDVDLANLRHHACTEIRASMLSGECKIMNEIRRSGLGNFGGKFQACIRRRAIISVSANPQCRSKEDAEAAVDVVWSSCFNDTRPFERVYK